MNKIILTGFLYIFVFFHFLFAQQYYFRHYNIEDGLAQSQVLTIIQDRDGYLWLGTLDGLSRFDGHGFKNFNLKDGLAKANVSAAFEDREGKIWFGHEHGGITIYNPETKTFRKLSELENLPQSTIMDIVEDRQGNLWFGTFRMGVYKYNRKSFFHYDSSNSALTGRRVAALLSLPDGTLWFGHDRGITILPPGKEFTPENVVYLDKKAGLPKDLVTALLRDHLGNIWVGTQSHGIYVYGGQRKDGIPRLLTHFDTTNGLGGNWVTRIIEDSRQRIWISTFGGGITCYSPDTRTPLRGGFEIIDRSKGLKNNRAVTIYEDYEQTLWIGTYGGGVFQYLGKRFTAYGVNEGLLDKAVWSIFQDSRGNFWFGTENGINRLPAGRKPHPKNALTFRTNTIVLTISEDLAGNIWFGTFGRGIFYFQRKEKRFYHLTAPLKSRSRYISQIHRDRKGYLWITTFEGQVLKLDPLQKVYVGDAPLFTLDNAIYASLLDREETLWLGTEGKGLLKYRKGELISLQDKFPSMFPVVNSICQDTANRIWFSTPGGGLFCLDGDSLRNYTTADGLSSDNLYSVVTDSRNNIWVGTTRGVDKFDGTRFIHYGKSDGFTGIETNQNAVFRDVEGNIWFGTINGAFRYNPEEEYTVDLPPLTHLTHLELFYQDIPLIPRAEFAPDENFLTFHFIGLSFSNPEKIKYQYKLEGFEKEWSPLTSHNFVTYSNLPPGTYVFKVKACNGNGIWTTHPVEYEFTILAPFWRTWWFFSLILFSLATVVVAGHKRRVRNIQNRSKVLEKMVAERTRDILEAKQKTDQAFKALQESEEKFKALAESTASAIFIYKGPRYCYVNQATEKITGYQREELLRMNFWDVVHPEFRELVKKQGLARQKGEDIPTQYEFKIVTKTGEERWVHFSATKIIYEGSPAALGTAFDITDRKIAEEALKESEQRYRLLFDLLPFGGEVLDKQGYIRDCSASETQLLGYNREELIGKHITELLDEESAQNFKQRFQNLLKGESQQAEIVMIDKNGQKLHISRAATPIYNRQGELIGILALNVNITERKIMEEALLEEKERLAVTLQSIGDAVIATNVDNRIIIMNRAAQALSGWSQEEALGKKLNDVFKTFNGKDYRPTTGVAEKALQSGKKILNSGEVRLIARDGTEKIINESAAPIYDPSGNIIGVVVVYRDITEKRKLEDELLKMQKLESLGILAGGIAHDFNNILTAIMGNLSLAKMKIERNHEIFQRLLEAERATIRARDLTHQLLTFSKGGAPVKQTASIAEIIKESAQFSLAGTNVKFQTRFPSDLWAVEVDIGQISQVIQNLVINAQQAMPAGGIIEITAENVLLESESKLPLEPGPYVKITIKDEGIGIPEKHLDKIFDPYFTTKQQGSGLGLATTYSIIKRHNGYITVSSQINLGTTFYIYLPALKNKKVSPISRVEPHLSGKGKILVMDDEKTVRDILGHMLNHLGYEVEYAAEGKEAIRKYQEALKAQQPFKLVIMDLTIPNGMGGRETIQRLKEIDPAVRAIVSSGYSNDEIIAEYQKFGFQGYMAKPFRLKDLIEVLKRTLKD